VAGLRGWGLNILEDWGLVVVLGRVWLMVAVVLGLQGGTGESEQQLQNISLLHSKLAQIYLCPFVWQVFFFFISQGLLPHLLFVLILEDAFSLFHSSFHISHLLCLCLIQGATSHPVELNVGIILSQSSPPW